MDSTSVLLSRTCLRGVTESVGEALRMLRRSCELAMDVSREKWAFAIEIDRLRAVGLNECDLRWLEFKGWTENAEEVTAVGGGERTFGDPGGARYSNRTCFVLTELGFRVASQSDLAQPLNLKLDLRVDPPDEVPVQLKPEWNPTLRTLTVLNRIVKRYRVPAENQELILRTFAEEDWTVRVDDPLPPVNDIDPKRRLQSAIMCLNRNQRNPLIRFRGDGSGMGILWELRKEHAAC